MYYFLKRNPFLPSQATLNRNVGIYVPSKPRRCFFVTLAIETSCDDTSIAVLEVNNGCDQPLTEPSKVSAKLHFHSRRTANSALYRGVHPSLAAKSHQLFLRPLLQQALEEGLPDADVTKDGENSLFDSTENGTKRLPIRCSKTGLFKWKRKPDLIAVTRGPGMASSLSAGVGVAQGLSSALQIPLVGVHHMLGHAWTPSLCYALGLREKPTKGFGIVAQAPSEFPSYSLLVSGGHTMLTYSGSPGCHKILTNTIDTAVGDALDKAGRLILPELVVKECSHTSYGALLEDFAFPIDNDGRSNGVRIPEHYIDIYQPPSSSKVGARRTDPVWGWSFALPFANNSRDNVFNSVAKLTVRNKTVFPNHDEGPNKMALPFTFSGLVSNVERFMNPKERRVWNDDKNGFNVLERVPSLNATGDDESGPITTEERRALARAVLTIAFETLAEVVVDAVALHQARMNTSGGKSKKTVPLILAGGVSANSYLRYILQSYLSSRTVTSTTSVPPEASRSALGRSVLPVELVVCPTPSSNGLARELCTDNAVMIAWAGTWMHHLGIRMSRTKDTELLGLAQLEHGMADPFGLVAPSWSLEELETHRSL